MIEVRFFRRHRNLIVLAGLCLTAACGAFDGETPRQRLPGRNSESGEEYDPTGTFKERGHYKNGQREGWWTSFLGDQPESETFYKDGRMMAKRYFEGIDRQEAIQQNARKKTMSRLELVRDAMNHTWDWTHWLAAVGGTVLVLGGGFYLTARMSRKKSKAADVTAPKDQ